MRYCILPTVRFCQRNLSKNKSVKMAATLISQVTNIKLRKFRENVQATEIEFTMRFHQDIRSGKLQFGEK